MSPSQIRRQLLLSPEQVEAFARRINVAVREVVKPYGDSGEPDFDRDLLDMNARSVELYFRALAEDRVPSEQELAAIADAARRRLHQGIPLESIFHSYRVGSRLLWECLLEVADPKDLGRLATLTLEFNDLVSGVASEGYVRERERAARSHEEATRMFLTRLLSGDLTDEEAVTREGRHLGFDLAGTHVVAVAAPGDRARQMNVQRDLDLVNVRSQLQRYLPQAPAVLMRAGLIVVIPGDSVPEVSSTIVKALAGVPGGQQLRIGLGTARGGPAGILASYSEAQRALTLASILQPNEKVLRYDELRLFDLFKTGETVDAFVDEVLGPLLKRDRGRGSEFTRTLEALFAEALNRKLAARRMGIHPNTLTYRTRRIEELLGGSLVDGEFCFRVQLALKLRPLSTDGRVDVAPLPGS